MGLQRILEWVAKNTGVGCHFLLQEIFPTQGSNPGLLHCRQIFFFHLSHQGSQKAWDLTDQLTLTYTGVGGVFQVELVVKNPLAKAGDIRDTDSIPGLGRSPGWGHGNPLQYSCLENPMDRGPWWATVHRVAKSWTRLKPLSTHTPTR